MVRSTSSAGFIPRFLSVGLPNLIRGCMQRSTRGLSWLRGRVLAYLNGDDIYFPWSVDCAVSALMSSRADLAFGDLIVLAKQGGRSRTVRIQFYPRFHARVYAYELNLGQPSVFWKRSVSDEVGGFDERMRYCGDFEYWLRTATAGFRYTHVREVLATAVEHEEALSTTHADELQREIERTRERYADRLKARNFVRLHALAHLAQWRLQVLMLRFNLRRGRPSSWPKLIRFLKGMDTDLTGSSVLRLILPLPLPRSWIMWRLDPTAFERKLIHELQSDHRIA